MKPRIRPLLPRSSPICSLARREAACSWCSTSRSPSGRGWALSPDQTFHFMRELGSGEYGRLIDLSESFAADLYKFWRDFLFFIF